MKNTFRFFLVTLLLPVIAHADNIVAYTVSSPADSPTGMLSADATQGTLTNGYAVGLYSRAGLTNGLGSGLTVSVVGNFTDAVGSSVNAFQGATGVAFVGGASSLIDPGSIASTITVSAETGRAMGLFLEYANFGADSVISGKIDVISQGAQDNNHAYGIYAARAGTNVGSFTGTLSVTASNLLAYGISLNTSASMTDISGSVMAYAGSTIAYGLFLNGTSTLGSISQTGDILAIATAASAYGGRVNNSSIDNLAGTVRAQSQTSDAFGLYIIGSTLGGVASTASVSAMSTNAGAYAFMATNSTLGDVAGRFGAVGRTAVQGMRLHALKGTPANILSEARISATSTAGIATALSMSASELGSVNGSLSGTSFGGVGYGLFATNSSTISTLGATINALSSTSYAIGLQVHGSKIGAISDLASISAVSSASGGSAYAYAVSALAGADIGTISGHLYAQNIRKASALNIAAGASVGDILATARLTATASTDSSAITMSGGALGNVGGALTSTGSAGRGYGIFATNSAVIGNILDTATISGYSENENSYGIYLNGSASMGYFAGNIVSTTSALNSTAYGLTLMGGNTMTTFSGKIRTEGYYSAAGYQVLGGSTAGDLLEGTNIYARSVTGQSYGVRVSDAGSRIGNVAGTFYSESTGSHAYGIVIANSASAGAITGAASISAKSGDWYASGLLASNYGTFETVSGKIYAENASEQYSAVGIHYSNTLDPLVTINRVLYLGAGAHVAAKNTVNSANAFAVSNAVGSLTIHGDAVGTQTFVGGINARDNVTLGNGKFYLDHFGATSHWFAMAVDEQSRLPTAFSDITISAGALATVAKPISFAADTVYLDGQLVLRANSLTDNTKISLKTLEMHDGSTHATDLHVGQTGKITIILGQNFMAEAGDTMDVILAGAQSYITGDFEGCIELVYEGGTIIIDPEKYEFDGRTITFLQDIPEPAAAAGLLGLLALSLAARRRRR